MVVVSFEAMRQHIQDEVQRAHEVEVGSDDDDDKSEVVLMYAAPTTPPQVPSPQQPLLMPAPQPTVVPKAAEVQCANLASSSGSATSMVAAKARPPKKAAAKARPILGGVLWVVGLMGLLAWD